MEPRDLLKPFEIALPSDDFALAVGHLSLVWSAIEGMLTEIFSLLLNQKEFAPTAETNALAGSIFQPIRSLQMRAQIVDNQIRTRVKNAEIMSSWKDNKRMLEDLSKERNTVIHGQYTVHLSINQSDGVMNRKRLIGPSQDRLHSGKSTEEVDLESVYKVCADSHKLFQSLGRLNSALQLEAGKE